MLRLENNEVNFQVEKHAMLCELFVPMVLKLHQMHF